MSPRLPSVKPHQVLSVLQEIGFYVDRQTGSHYIMRRDTDRRLVVVPMHNRDMGQGLLHKIIKDAGLTREEFLELL